MCLLSRIADTMREEDFRYNRVVLPAYRSLMYYRRQRWLVDSTFQHFSITSSSHSTFVCTKEDVRELIFDQNLTQEEFLQQKFHLIPEYNESDERLKIFRNCQDPQRCFRAMAELSRRLTPSDAYKEEMRKLEEDEDFDKKFIYGHENLSIRFNANILTGEHSALYPCEIIRSGNEGKNRLCRARLFRASDSEARASFLSQAKWNSSQPPARHEHHPHHLDHFVKVLGVSVVNDEDPAKIRLVILEEEPRFCLRQFLLLLQESPPTRSILKLVTQIAYGLKALHDKNQFHGRLNLQSCLLFEDSDDDQYHVKLCNFGCLSTKYFSFIAAFDSHLEEADDDDDHRKIAIIKRADVHAFALILHVMLAKKNQLSSLYDVDQQVGIENNNNNHVMVHELLVKLYDDCCGGRRRRSRDFDCSSSGEYHRDIISQCQEEEKPPKDGSELVARLERIIEASESRT